MSAAARWIDDHSRHHDRFFLFVDEFDPHEPFDTPEPWASRYDDEWDVAKGVRGFEVLFPPALDALGKQALCFGLIRSFWLSRRP